MSPPPTPESLSLTLTPGRHERHPAHYYSDGTFIFIMESTTIFRIYQDILARRSSVLAVLFSGPVTTMFDGLPAAHFADVPAQAFSDLMDIVIPGPIRTPPKPTFRQVSGIYRLATKWEIQDVLEWAEGWLDSLIPWREEDIARLKDDDPDAVLQAQIISFALELPRTEKYLPLAFYTLSVYPWDLDTPSDLDAYERVHEILPPSTLFKIDAAKFSIKAYTGAFIHSPYFPPAVLCFACSSQHTALAKDFMMGYLAAPLEELDEMIEDPPKNLCRTCEKGFKYLCVRGRREIYATKFEEWFGVVVCPYGFSNDSYGSRTRHST